MLPVYSIALSVSAFISLHVTSYFFKISKIELKSNMTICSVTKSKTVVIM